MDRQEIGLLLFAISVLSVSGFSSKSLRRAFIQTSFYSQKNHKGTIADMFIKPMDMADRPAYWMPRDEEGRYLEEVEGEAAVNWVTGRNKALHQVLGDPSQDDMYNKVLAIFDSKDKIPYVSKIGSKYYNFWRDEANPRGIWRRTSLDSYMSSSTDWETVLDIDALCESEDASWVWNGSDTFYPDSLSEEASRTLISLSPGGSDAKIFREFDLQRKCFVNEDNGFHLLNASKYQVSWLDQNTLLIGTNVDDIKNGLSSSSMTDSGYPRLVMKWERGTPLAAASIVFEAESSDVAVYAALHKHRGCSTEIRTVYSTYYASRRWVRLGTDLSWSELPLPLDAGLNIFADQALVTLRSNWTLLGFEYAAGSVLAMDIKTLIHTNPGLKPGLDAGLKPGLDAGLKPGLNVTVLFSPCAKGRSALESLTVTRNYVILHILEEVRSRLSFWRYSDNSVWRLESSEERGVIRGLWLAADDDDRSDKLWVSSYSFIQPSTLYLIDAAEGTAALYKAVAIKALPAQFSSMDLEESQGMAVSADGESIPYFLIRRKGSLDKETPCLLYGYGGFEISMTPSYLGATGKCWLERGYTYAIANIRGGSEFGPRWHQEALKDKRNKAYEDFIAVAEHLISTGVTSPHRLGIRGGSNGGLLMGNMYVSRPDLFRAVVCDVPLLDMKRYSKLLAGSSWMAEYGDPGTDDWDRFLKKYSAYHNIDPSGLTVYPQLLLTSSMRDDRVHPYHARAFAKRLIELGVEGVAYYENVEGGHAGASDSKQQAYTTVLYIRFLEKSLK